MFVGEQRLCENLPRENLLRLVHSVWQQFLHTGLQSVFFIFLCEENENINFKIANHYHAISTLYVLLQQTVPRNHALFSAMCLGEWCTAYFNRKCLSLSSDIATRFKLLS